MPWLSPCLNVRNPNPTRSCPSAQLARKPRRPCGCFCAGPATIPRAKVCATRQNALSRPLKNSFPAIKKMQRACSLASSRKSMAMTMWFSSATSRFRRTASTIWCPFFGMAHVAYYPSETGVVGLSKLARLVDIYAKRLQTQEAMTAQIIGAIDQSSAPARLCRHARGAASVHVHARCSQTRRGNHHDAIHRHLSRRSRRASPFFDNAARRQVKIGPAPRATASHSGTIFGRIRCPAQTLFAANRANQIQGICHSSGLGPMSVRLSMNSSPPPDTSPASKKELEEGTCVHAALRRRWLIVCVTKDARDGQILMLAYMNAEALRLTHRNRHRALLVAITQDALAKGRYIRPDSESHEIRTDCDQDACF